MSRGFTEKMKDFKQITENLKEMLSLTSDKELAEKLNLKSQAFSERKRTNSIPHKEILELCITEKLDINKLYDNNLNDVSINYKNEINKILDTYSNEKIESLYKFIKTSA